MQAFAIALLRKDDTEILQTAAVSSSLGSALDPHVSLQLGDFYLAVRSALPSHFWQFIQYVQSLQPAPT